MKLVVPEPDIDLYKDGFKGHDLLGRSDTGKRLSDVLERIDDPLVVALDGAWGSGKSFFLKCWVGEHLKEEHGHIAQTIYFDAFQHDYLDDPLIALTGVLAERFQDDDKRTGILHKARTAAAKLARPALRIGLAIGTAGASEMAGPLVDAGFAAGSDELEEAAIKTFWKKEDGKRAAVEAFRHALTDLTHPDDAGSPTEKLVLVIDELDRCRPDYALAVLEVAKHFFSVPGVHFVLGANLRQLEHSVRARYGDGVDAPRYLQKFVNLTMTFPKPRFGTDVVEYLDKAATSVGIDEGIRQELEMFLSLPGIANRVEIRDVQRILTRCALLPEGFSRHLWPHQFVVLAAIIIESLDQPKLSQFKARICDENEILEFFFGSDYQSSEQTGSASALTALINVYLARDPDPEAIEFVRDRRGVILGDTPNELSATIRRCLDQFEIPNLAIS